MGAGLSVEETAKVRCRCGCETKSHRRSLNNVEENRRIEADKRGGNEVQHKSSFTEIFPQQRS